MMTKNHEDVALWPDGTWCFGEDLESFLQMMSDDYVVLELGSEAWQNLMDQEELGPNY